MNIFNRCFFKFYPSQPKHADTQAGLRLRRALLVSLIMHACFFVLALTYIGFYVMVMEIFFVSWVYTCYLTLHEWAIVVYLFALVIGMIHGVFSVIDYEDVSLLFFIILLVFYALCFFYTGKRYMTFRSHGGIHGTVDRVVRKSKKSAVREKMLDGHGPEDMEKGKKDKKKNQDKKKKADGSSSEEK